MIVGWLRRRRFPTGQEDKGAPSPQATPPPQPQSLLPFQIRPLEPADLPALLTVFQQAIQEGSREHYNQQQRDAWSQAHDQQSLSTVLSQGETVVAEWDDRPVGFGHRQDDYLNMLFVHPEACRLGIATQLYQYLEDSARIAGLPRLTTHASHSARGFFSFMGFEHQEEEQVERNRVALGRHLMSKYLH